MLQGGESENAMLKLPHTKIGKLFFFFSLTLTATFAFQ